MSLLFVLLSIVIIATVVLLTVKAGCEATTAPPPTSVLQYDLLQNHKYRLPSVLQ